MIGTLALWHVFGANTSDDGYLLGMARVSEHSGYMANYFRWFGVPEAPFGWYYDVLALFAKVSTASMWMRLPALIDLFQCPHPDGCRKRTGARTARGTHTMSENENGQNRSSARLFCGGRSI